MVLQQVYISSAIFFSVILSVHIKAARVCKMSSVEGPKLERH